MIVARSAWDLRRAVDSVVRKTTVHPIEDLIRERPRIAFIPTMGALHEGHISLISEARKDRAPITVASVFVNPSQFAEGEDFATYPRPELNDLELLERAAVDVAFLPSVDDVYPASFGTQVLADPKLSSCLCGSSRGASHFDGVVTVVARLFGLVRPDTALFGEKDWQQLQIIKRMAADIHPGVEVVGSPTIRAEDGLALSSRNINLDREGRTRALAIPEAIQAAQQTAAKGGSATACVEAGTSVLAEAGLKVDYFEIRSSRDLVPVEDLSVASPDQLDHPRVFVAASLGGVRLIDNQNLIVSRNQQTNQQGA
jgi:pantoate--beta-alanine ligase